MEQDYSVKSPNNGLVKRLGSGSTRFKLSVKVFIFANISAPNLKFLFISSFYLLQIHIYSANLNFVNTNCENRALREIRRGILEFLNCTKGLKKDHVSNRRVKYIYIYLKKDVQIPLRRAQPRDSRVSVNGTRVCVHANVCQSHMRK